MAIDIPDWSSKTSDQLEKEAQGVFERPQLSDLDPALLELYTKMRESLAKINEHITKVSSMQSEIDTEKSKTGITTAQADAITANTAKTGITTAQASAITANSAKTGISPSQTSQLVQLGKSQIPVGAGTLSIEFNGKTNALTFTYRQGKITKTGALTLK
jgi:phage terminase small subunit